MLLPPSPLEDLDHYRTHHHRRGTQMNTLYPKLYDKELERVMSEFPEFRIVKKSDSYFMKLLFVLLVVLTLGAQRTFMSAFTTTIGSTMYVPSKWGEWSNFQRHVILAHEAVHLRQQRRHGKLRFALLYLFCSFPILWATYRTMFEKEAYEESMRIRSYYYGASSLRFPSYKAQLLSNFTSGKYMWMCLSNWELERWYEVTVSCLEDAEKDEQAARHREDIT